MPGPGPTTKAILVNIILEGRLKELLTEWRRTSSPPLQYEQCAELINEMIREVADRWDAETETFTWQTLRSWSIYYNVETPRKRS